MSRPRLTNPLNLPKRVRFKHGAFYYAHKDGRWEPLGTDLKKAITQARHIADTGGKFGTMAWYFDEFLKWGAGRVAANKLSQRTLDDYTEYVKLLTIAFGHLTPSEITPADVQRYLDAGVELDRAIAANREKAGLSACMSWIRTRRPEAGLVVNPCFGVRRNPESPSDTYVETAEYANAYKRATPMAKAYAELVYRTLQRPADVLSWTRVNLRPKELPDGSVINVIRFRQSKTKAELEIEIDAHLESVLAPIKRDVIGVTLIHTRKAKSYTEDGIGSMWRRWCNIAKRAGENTRTFGVMDLRAKGATDMYQAGVPLETIQALMGHESVTTTEIYVKQHLKVVVKPNQTKGMRA